MCNPETNYLDKENNIERIKKFKNCKTFSSKDHFVHDDIRLGLHL